MRISADSVGARLLIDETATGRRIHGAFTATRAHAMPADDGTLTYELEVRRTGSSGTTQSVQSGAFEPVVGQTDTLSTVEVNVQPGDRLRLRLVVRAGPTAVDSATVERTVP